MSFTEDYSRNMHISLDCRNARRDKIRNKDIHDKIDVAPIGKKMRENYI